MFSVFQQRFRPVPAQAGEMEPFCLQCPKDGVQSSQARCCDHSQSTSHKCITVLKLSSLGRIDMHLLCSSCQTAGLGFKPGVLRSHILICQYLELPGYHRRAFLVKHSRPQLYHLSQLSSILTRCPGVAFLLCSMETPHHPSSHAVLGSETPICNFHYLVLIPLMGGRSASIAPFVQTSQGFFWVSKLVDTPNFRASRESSRVSAAVALGLLPHDPERLALLQSAASSETSAQLQAAALEALGAVLPAAVELQPAREAAERLLVQLLGQLLHHRPELAAEVGSHHSAAEPELRSLSLLSMWELDHAWCCTACAKRSL